MTASISTVRDLVAIWSGWEIKALRHARRMTTREFGEHLGVSDRIISKWEAGGRRLRPRQQNQAALDTSLAMAGAVAQQRFIAIVAERGTSPGNPQTAADPSMLTVAPKATHLVRYPVEGSLMTFVEAGPFVASVGRRAVWLPAFYVDVSPVSCAAYSAFLDATNHRPPVAWSATSKRHISYEPSDGDEPMTGLDWDDAIAYAAWAGKELPTVEQWLRAVDGPEGASATRLREWCQDGSRPGRCGPKRARTDSFRCVTAHGDMLALLAI